MEKIKTENGMPEGVDLMGHWSRGRVYLAKKENLKEARRCAQKGDVVILEDRDAADPNLQVQQSWRIRRRRNQKEIANVMLAYNAAHPLGKGWNRTAGSIVTEWRIHNLAYLFGYKRDHSGDCDLNNADEGKTIFGFIGR